MPEVEHEENKGRMGVAQTGFVGQKSGLLIKQQIMKCFVRVQETSAGNDQSHHERGSDYDHRHGIEVMLKPALDEALPFDRIEFARARRNFPRRLQFLAGRDYPPHSPLSFRPFSSLNSFYTC